MHGAKSERGEGEKATMCRRGTDRRPYSSLGSSRKIDGRARQRQRRESGIHVFLLERRGGRQT